MKTKTILLWSLYDFATTPVAFAINALYLPLILIEISGSTALVGLLPLITGGVAALWTPLAGAILDRSAKRSFSRKLIVSFSVILGGTTIVLISWTRSVLVIVFLFTCMTVTIQTGWTAMNSFYAQEENPRNLGFTSAAGIMMGYLGGAIGAGAAVLSEQFVGRSAALILIGIFLAVFGTISVIFLSETRMPSSFERKSLFESLKTVLHEIRMNRSLKAYLLGSMLWGDAVATIVTFSSLLTINVLGFPSDSVSLFLAMALPAALLGAFLHGYLGDRIGLLRLLTVNLILWACGIGLIMFWGSSLPPFLVTTVAGFALGGNLTLSRALYARIIPEGMEARLFGLAAIFIFFGGAIGPFLTGIIADMNGMTLASALIVPLLFVIAALPLIRFIDISGPFESYTKH